MADDDRNPLTETLLLILTGPPGTAQQLAGGAFRSLVGGALNALSGGIQGYPRTPKRGRVANEHETDETTANRR
jgi:hypothetical protein